LRKKVVLLIVLAPIIAVGGGVALLRLVHGGDWQSLLQPWGAWASTGVTFVALLTAAGYYTRAVVQNRATHEFDVLMRTVAVYHDLIPKKRSVASGYLLDRLTDRAREAAPEEQLAIIDLMNYFDDTCWRAFTTFKMDLGKCKVAQTCNHSWRSRLQQRHEGVRVILREVAYPASIYYRVLEAVVMQGDSGAVVGFPLGVTTQFHRMVTNEKIKGYLRNVKEENDSSFLEREKAAPSLRTSLVSIQTASESVIERGTDPATAEMVKAAVREALEDRGDAGPPRHH